MLDPYWRGGDYYRYSEGPEAGLGVARMIGMITYQSDASMAGKFGRRLMEGPRADIYDLATQFEVESYLHYQGRKLAKRFDANTYIYLRGLWICSTWVRVTARWRRPWSVCSAPSWYTG